MSDGQFAALGVVLLSALASVQASLRVPQVESEPALVEKLDLVAERAVDDDLGESLARKPEDLVVPSPPFLVDSCDFEPAGSVHVRADGSLDQRLTGQDVEPNVPLEGFTKSTKATKATKRKGKKPKNAIDELFSKFA